ncbi:glutamine--fructose-6-phosphate transaminase (isomerizing) [Candidatus Uhrbacteria bacterium CG10_big_fil_rev_8_21_14_0_10_48_16]|uniref:Glutamine--fructose-6-phosphate aminotransferase [isomerizing] n=1 Tax=Candidatus Uhrbacteria bacterium CG10_big_fil_rev_8_21_14_0_10_48_16 TaxID=1975038 RepID=A0A2M8LG60_9BACT|nr:MAG: glutamine--fructose-6-phosphate transaminase (isomerizing) [Candidatus Uhrbacteria bacterium CG10_big_fil_rev_8_21_14_0_10_48_16]
MCGIVGYVGSRQATPILMNGLSVLEYRGYDSAGICVQNGRLTTIRAEGKLVELEKKVKRFESHGTCGIAHTRWATHGVPEERNAHPHRDCTGSIALVHNGIIENYQELKADLMSTGHLFSSDTDSEVLAHMIEERMKNEMPLLQAVEDTLAHVRGTYGLVVVSKDVPQTLIAARMGSPLVIGVGEDEHYIASDPSALIAYTKDVIYLDDGEIAVVTSEGVHLNGSPSALTGSRQSKIDWDVEETTKGGHPHFMLKEIMEQPKVIEDSLRGRMDLIHGRCILGGLEGIQDRLAQIDRIVIVGCGSAYYAGLVGEYLIEEIAGIPVEVELASEFRYRKPLISERTAVLAISQSGETADTLEAIREAKRKHALTLGLVNTVGSSIARETDAGVYNHAGPEVGVASTKAFVSQLTTLTLIAIYLGQLRGVHERTHALLAGLAELPKQVQEILDHREQILEAVTSLGSTEHCLFLGRKFHAPIAYEGALKLKEVSYVHAEGYTSGEMKHGPIALIDKSFPSIVLCPKDSMFEKTWSNIEELKARGGMIIAITTDRESVGSLVDACIEIPQTLEELQPILSVIPTQLLAYEMAVARSLDPDKPRNLAKSVTVE